MVAKGEGMPRSRSGLGAWVLVGVVLVASGAGRSAVAQDLGIRGGWSEEALGLPSGFEAPVGFSEPGDRKEPEISSTFLDVSGASPTGPSLAGLPTSLQLRAGEIVEDGAQEAHGEKHAELSDLTLLNFFTEGWSDPWAHRHRKTPDMALLRVTTNFLEREFRFDYQGTHHVDRNKKVQRTDFVDGLIAYGLDRRLMIEVIANYQWNHHDRSLIVDGPGAAILARFQLVDTEESSYAFQFRASAPNKSIGQTASTLSPTLTGWQDLDAAIGLDRVGVYYSVTWDNLHGPVADGTRTNSLGYDLTLAKTWTDPKTPGMGNFTTFLELFATTDLDGQTTHHTALSLTPGFRFWIVPENSLTLGVDFPVSYPHPYSEVFRVTYILNF